MHWKGPGRRGAKGGLGCAQAQPDWQLAHPIKFLIMQRKKWMNRHWAHFASLTKYHDEPVVTTLYHRVLMMVVVALRPRQSHWRRTPTGSNHQARCLGYEYSSTRRQHYVSSSCNELSTLRSRARKDLSWLSFISHRPIWRNKVTFINMQCAWWR